MGDNSGDDPILGYYGEWVEISLGAALNESFKDTFLQKLIVETIYPIGSIYMSVQNVNPSILFGGTWEKIEDRFLLAAGASYPATYDSNGIANNKDGEETHTLTIDEMPSHNHKEGQYLLKNNETASLYSHVTNWSNHYGDEKVTTSSSGGGQAHNNMPPYLVVNVWYRVE